jgi:protoporphyrinogen oxidase
VNPVVVVGAGASGIAAAYELARNSMPVVVLESGEKIGGLARTIERNGLRYDVGPHRFFTKNADILRIWHEVLGEDSLSVNRYTRILYRDKLFRYPIEIRDMLRLGLPECMMAGLSYGMAKVRGFINPTPIRNFEDWVTQQFGYRLFATFFKVYTEKIWGIPCELIEAEWAGQRIKGLSPVSALLAAVSNHSKSRPRTLVDCFLYPRYGAGYFYESMAGAVLARNGKVLANHKCVRINHENGRIRSVVAEDKEGQKTEIEADSVISSAPMNETLMMLSPSAPPDILSHASKLRYRGHMAVNLEVEGRFFPDQWLYVHATNLKMARTADYGNFSEEMTGRNGLRPLTVEYFAFTDDELWRTSDKGLVELAKSELQKCGMFDRARVLGGVVVRHATAYPMLERGYRNDMEPVKAHLCSLNGLQMIGRGGMYRYNNQDHAIATGLLAARNLCGGRYDVWKVNTDASYHESGNWDQKNG